MTRFYTLIICVILALSIINPVFARRNYRRGGSHSYPHSAGLSGSRSHHSYPKSPGLSGSGRHTYPSSVGLSGGGNHGYPRSGGLSRGTRPVHPLKTQHHSNQHAYPASTGLSGNKRISSPGHTKINQHNSARTEYPSKTQHHSNQHGYPASSGLPGKKQNAPPRHTKLNKHNDYNSARPTYPSNTQHHSNQHGYPASSGLSGNKQSPSPGHTTINNHYNYNYNPPQQIRYTPVHGGAPVSYPVYHGTPPTYVYQYKDSGSKYGRLLAGLALFNLGALGGYAVGHSGSNSHSNYKPAPGEVCKFGIKKDNGGFEETRIDCQLITSFILQAEAETQHNQSLTNTTVANTNTTTTVTNAVDVKGPAVQVTPSMQCYVIRHTPSSNMKKIFPCALLQTYLDQSVIRNAHV